MRGLLFLIIGASALPVLEMTHLSGGRFLWVVQIGLLVVVVRLVRDAEARKTALGLFRVPVTYFFLIYMILGWLSGIGVPDKFMFGIEFNRRFHYFFVPWLTGVLIATKPKDWLFAMIGYLVFGLYAINYCVSGGIAVGFKIPVGDWAAMHRNALADMVVASYTVALGFLLSLRPWKFRIPLLVYCLLGVAAVVATQSRGGILTAGMSTFILVMAKPFKWVYKAILILAFVGLLGGAIAAMPKEVMEERANLTGGSAAARPYLWTMAFQLIQEDPLRTWGMGNKPKNDRGEVLDNYCNWLVQDYMEGGFLQAIASLGIVVYSVVMALKNNRIIPARSPVRVVNLVAIVIILCRYLHGSIEAYWDLVYEHCIVYYLVGFLTYTQVFSANAAQDPRLRDAGIAANGEKL